jgi:hypothetical protein
MFAHALRTARGAIWAALRLCSRWITTLAQCECSKALGLKTALASGFREVDLDLFQGFADKLGGFVNAYQMMLSTFSVAGMLSPSETVFIKKWMDQGLNEQ